MKWRIQMNKNKLLLIGLLIIFSFSIFAEQTKIDSLENKLKTASDKEKLLLLEELIETYSKTSPTKVMEYAEHGLKIAEKLNLLKEKADFLLLAGDGCFLNCDYGQTLNYFYDALRIYEQLNDITKCGKISKTIADVLYETHTLNEALKYYEKAYDLMQKVNDKLQMATISHNIATVHVQKNEDPVKALEYYFEALELFKEVGTEQEVFITLANIGNAYHLLGEFSQSFNYLNEALQISQKMGDRRLDASILQRIASNFRAKKDFPKAIEYYIKSNEICKNDYPDIRWINYQDLSYIYSDTHDYRNALDYTIKAITLRDSLNSVESEEKIAEIKTKYETEKKEQQIEILEKDNKIQNMTRNYFIVGFIFAFILAVILYNRYRIKSKANKELTIARSVAEEANLMKTELLGIAAHDLKNPLNSILGFSKLIKQEIPERTRSSEFLDVIEESSEEMLSLINHLLNSSAIETGKITLEPVPVKFNDLAFSLISVMTSPASLKEQKIVYKENDTDIIVKADKGRLKEVMDNLLSNAIKYSEYGKTIWVRLNKDKDKAIFEVQDEGPGFTDEDKKKLFGRFQKLSARPTGGEGSTGLGLSIAKQLIELQDGTIEVESEPGKGSTFRIILPILDVEDISEIDNLEEEKAELETEEIIFEPTTVVIADDIGENRKLIRNLLSNQEFTIFEAKNGKELVELAHKVKPGIIFTDVQMPEMNGYEATKKLKEDEKYKEIPIIAVTASTMKTEESKAKAAGCDGFIRKPVSNESLMEELKRFIPPKETIVKEEKIEEEEIIELSEEVKARLSELLKILTDEMTEKCEKVKTNFVIGEIEDFGEKIRNLGAEYQIELIANWADKLLAETQSFDIGKIQISLNKFPQLVEKIKNEMEEIK